MSGSSHWRFTGSVPPFTVRPFHPLFDTVTPLIAGLDAMSMLTALDPLFVNTLLVNVGLLFAMRNPAVLELRITLLVKEKPLVRVTTEADEPAPPKRTSTWSSTFPMLVALNWILFQSPLDPLARPYRLRLARSFGFPGIYFPSSLKEGAGKNPAAAQGS